MHPIESLHPEKIHKKMDRKKKQQKKKMGRKKNCARTRKKKKEKIVKKMLKEKYAPKLAFFLNSLILIPHPKNSLVPSKLFRNHLA